MSITSANSVLLLGVLSVFPIAQEMQGFAADDAYSMTEVDVAETRMGVDGKMSSGWIPQIKIMSVSLQPDSVAIPFFEAWYSANEATQDTYSAFGVVHQPSVGRAYELKNGVLKNYSPMADAKKVLEPRKFQIHWSTVVPVPL